MFFGKEIKTNQNKASAMTMETDIKLSQAVLDPASKSGKSEPVCLLAEIQGKSFILAVLDPTKSWQAPLDLLLAAGTEVKFYVRGQGTIHLTGYEFVDEALDDIELSSSSDEEEEEQDDTVVEPVSKKIKVKKSPQVNGVKPKAAKMNASGDAEMDDSDDDDSEDLSFGSEDGDDDDDDDDEEDDLDGSDMDDVDLDELSSSHLDEESDDSD